MCPLAHLVAGMRDVAVPVAMRWLNCARARAVNVHVAVVTMSCFDSVIVHLAFTTAKFAVLRVVVSATWWCFPLRLPHCVSWVQALGAVQCLRLWRLGTGIAVLVWTCAHHRDSPFSR